MSEYQLAHREAAEQLDITQSQLREAKDERLFWEQIAAEIEQAKTSLEQRLVEQQSISVAQSKGNFAKLVSAANTAANAVQLDEADTRKIIDQQLRLAGWEADSEALKYNKGARPEKNRNRAIAEWPTESGPADYVLFVGLTPVAVVEAKRKNIDVSGALQQAKRYSRTFTPSTETTLPAENWGSAAAYRIPFAFSSNGRPFLRQLATKSGIWFCDLRRADNLGHPLDGWYTPEGLTALLKRDEAKAHEQLANEPFNYGFTLRYYQQDAIHAAEAAIEDGQREMLLAMATGTGKTKTCIALIYRLLKAKRFRRVLFLVDRSALGEQAANAFKDTRMENLQTFADIFGIKELEEQTPDTDTAVHIATVQGMVQRLLYRRRGRNATRGRSVRLHRGRRMPPRLSARPGTLRHRTDLPRLRRLHLQVPPRARLLRCRARSASPPRRPCTPRKSSARRSTPTATARPSSTAFLIDHEPPVQIKTELSTNGIVWKAGEEVKVYDARRNQIDLFTTPDEIKIDVEDFNRKVITESFNRVVCEYLAQELDPASRQKTLIFCVNDAHADLVVDLLKQAFAAQYGSIDDDAVIKITGAADKPLQLIRRYKNERSPNVAVTVDLLR